MIHYLKEKLYGITMYRLLLYFLLAILAEAVILAHFGLLPFQPVYLVYSAVLIGAFSWVTNAAFSKILKAPTNIESVYLTALILVFLLTPPKIFFDSTFILTALAAAVLANASKYILAVNKKHVFNPAAIALVLTGFFFRQPASWWVGTLYLAPLVLLGGLLITRKIGRSPMVSVFFTASILPILLFKHISGFDSLLTALNSALFHSPIFFLGFIMLTEPLTSPGTRNKQLAYAALVGLLASPYLPLGPWDPTPEMALVIGNIYTFFVSGKSKLLLKLKEKIQIAENSFEYVFEKLSPAPFTAGQYVEWTLPHPRADERGNRRYFTISSAPTDRDIRFGVKFASHSSTFKQAMLDMQPGDKLLASPAAGDFVLDRDPRKKIAFLAGGIGITPFRSMVQEIYNRGEKRDIVLLYSARREADLTYVPFFEKARKVGLKTFYTLTEEKNGRRIDRQMIVSSIPDYHKREFYICGPQPMLESMQTILHNLGLSRKHIHVENFG